MSRIAALLTISALIATLAGGTPVAAQQSMSVAIDDGGDGYLGWFEMNSKVQVYGSGLSNTQSVRIQLAQPPGDTPTVVSGPFCVTPDVTAGTWFRTFQAQDLAMFTDGPIEAQAELATNCQGPTIATGSDTSIVDLIYPTTDEVQIVDTDLVIEPLEATSTQVTGRQSERGSAIVTLDDEDPATNEIKVMVPTDQDGAWTAFFDASVLSDGRIRASSAPRDRAGNTGEALASAHVVKAPSTASEPVRPRVEILDGDGLLHDSPGTVVPEDLSRVPVLLTHTGLTNTARLRVTLSDGTNSVAAVTPVDDDSDPATDPVDRPSIVAPRDQDVIFYADVRLLSDGVITATATATSGGLTAEGLDTSRLDRTPPQTTITRPTNEEIIRCRAIWLPDIRDGDGALFSSYECDEALSGRITDGQVTGRRMRVLLEFRSLDPGIGGVKHVSVLSSTSGAWSLNLHSSKNWLGPGQWELVARGQDDAANIEPEREDGSNRVRFWIFPL